MMNLRGLFPMACKNCAWAEGPVGKVNASNLVWCNKWGRKFNGDDDRMCYEIPLELAGIHDAREGLYDVG